MRSRAGCPDQHGLVPEDGWDPSCQLPSALVWPTRIDPDGRTGPTRGQAQRARWRACARGWYVPRETDSLVPEQRILEQAVRVANTGAVTGWASLRWRGGAYFDGLSHGGRSTRPVPLLRSAGDIPRSALAQLSKAQLGLTERESVAGIWCTTTQRALFDEMRFDLLRGAVVSLDMAAAAGLISVRLFATYVAQRRAWTGVPLVRQALALASENSRSPQESRLRLVWTIDAGLPSPLCNRPVFDLNGNLLGYPDLFDPEAGLVGEYDGAHHKSGARHRRDVRREAKFRDHGLEYVEIVGGDLSDREAVVRRIHRARSRARFLKPEKRKWTLSPPPDWPTPPTLDVRLERAGLVSALTHT